VHPPTHANAQQELKGYSTKVHEIFISCRGIIIDVNAVMALRDIPIRCKMPPQTIKAGYANLSLSRATKIGCYGKVA